MKKYLFIGLALIAAAISCKQEPKISESAGPVQTITCDENALMGDVFSFSVNLEDQVALSTLKVELLFDETVVGTVSMRTPSNGVYDGTIEVPFLKNIPDGNATAVFTAQNTSFGVSEEKRTVKVSRPDFEYLTLKPVSGQEKRMEKTAKNVYSVTAVFESTVEATIETAPFGSKNRTLTFGYGESGVAVGAAGTIPFSGTAGEYTISLNTLSFEASPFNTMTVNGENTVRVDKNNFALVASFTKDGDVKIEGYEGSFEGWTIDPDYLEEVSAGNYKFLAPSGLYRFNIGLDKKFFLVEKMKSEGEYDSYSDDGSGTLWLIGEPATYGKPAIGSGTGWDTTLGLPLVENEAKKHSITLVAGTQLKSDKINIKFFHQKGWGGEFVGTGNTDATKEYKITTDSPKLSISDDGNVGLASGVTLTYGKSYRFTVETTNPKNAVLHFQELEGGDGPVGPERKFAGVDFSQLSPTTFQAVANISQGSTISITGFDDIADFDIDSDFFETISAGSYKLIPVSGYYKALVNTETKWISVCRASADGSNATLNADGTGAVWMIGANCFGKPVINTSSWSPSDGLCLAEVSPKVYHLTLVGGTQLAASGLNVKLFYQQGWGDEFGKAKYSGLDGLIDFHATDDGNIVYATGAKIELGAVYQFILDLTEGVESASLELKKIKDSDIVADEVKVNGVKLDLTAEDHYEGILNITKGSLMTVSGISSISDYVINPDLITADGKFAAVTGYYRAVVDRKDHYITGYRVADADGASPNLSQGGVFILGWGFSNISHASQPGWNPGQGAQMVEVESGIFQFTGVAGPAEPAVVGVRVRDSGWDCKYFFQDGWGGEASKGVTILGNAADKIDAAKQADSGNLGLASDLEAGATYRLTIDFTGCTVSGASITAGTEILTFEKL